MSQSHPAAHSRGRHARPHRIALRVCAVAAVLVIGAVAWVGVRGLLAKDELDRAIPLAAKIQDQVVIGDVVSVGETAGELSTRAARAASLTNDPIWRAFEAVPFLGPNLVAARQVAAVIDGVAQDAVGPLVEVAGAVKLKDFRPINGGIDFRPLVAARPQVAAASVALVSATEQVSAIDTSATLPVVHDAVVQLSAEVTKASGSVSDIDRAVRLLPSMLGASGPRDYLLLFQNPAELRATGGIPGAVVMIHTEGGQITLTQQASSADFQVFTTPVLPLADDTRGLYGDIAGEYIQDVNLTPNFPQSALLAREMWRLQFGVEADGVLSIDPVALSYLLRATGPITLASGDVLTPDNAVQLLLSDVYARYENPARQDEFFAAAAASVFSAVSSGEAEPVQLVNALAQAGGEHRVLVWNSREEDQAVVADTTLAGRLPVSDDSATRFGVYLNDATGAKMGMYLEMQVALGQVTCRKDERPNFGVSVTLRNTAPADAASTLSDYVTGGGVYGVSPGNVKTVLTAYGAPGMQNLGVTRDDRVVPYHPATDSTYPVSSIAVELGPGESTVLHFGWLGLEPSSAPIVAQLTPGIHLHDTRELELGCESALW